MTEHDALCVSQEFLPADLTRFCDCERVARIRADERERMLASVQWRHSVGDPSWSVECLTDNDAECPGCMCTCHAEAVAARLVEVICEDAALLKDGRTEAYVDGRIDGLREGVTLVRAQIAADIEADRDELTDVDRDTRSVADIRIGLSRAARIARGES